MRDLLELFLRPVFEGVSLLIGLALVEVLSLGHVKCLPARMKVEQRERRAWGLYVRRQNKIYLPVQVVALIGMLSLVLTVVPVCWLSRRTRAV